MPTSIFLVAEEAILNAGANSNPRLVPGSLNPRSSAGLNDKYHLPNSLSTIGRISQLHRSSEYRRRTHPISCERLTPTGHFHFGGTRKRGRMCEPTKSSPLPLRALVKR